MDVKVEVALIGGFFSVLVVSLKYYFDMVKKKREEEERERRKKNANPNELTVDEKRELLLSHHFFTRISYWVNSKIPILKIGDPLRELLIKKALTLKLREGANLIREDILDFSEERKTKYQTSSVFIERLVDLYESTWKLNGIPEVFIKKYHCWHIERITEAYYQYERLWDSKFYDDFETRLAVLDMWTYLFNWTIVDAEKTLEELNGELTAELTKLKKQGITEGWK